MNKNHTGILFVGLIFIALVISNLYFFKKTLDLNKEVNRIFELEASISSLKVEHRNELEQLKIDYEDEITRITDEYTEKFETVKKSLNAFAYELEEFYKNKHIMEKDYIENIKKLNEVQKELDAE